MSIFATIFSAAIKPISNVLTANTRRKQSRETGIQKIQQAQVDGENNLNMTDAEWEAVNAAKADTSWKDEYVTVTMTAWVWVALYGAILDSDTLNGVKIFMEFCTANGVDVGYLTVMVVMAAVGLKVWRGR